MKKWNDSPREKSDQDYIDDKQLIVPEEIIDKYMAGNEILNSLFVTRIGFFPKIKFHYRERRAGAPDNILFYCLGGKGYFHFNGSSFTLTPHHFVILPANIPHRYYADIEDPWTIYWVHYRGKKLSQFDEFFEVSKYLHPTEIKFDEKIIRAWEEMYQTIRSSFTPVNICNANLCLPRYISLFTHANLSTPDNPKRNISPEVKNFLRSNIDKMLSTEDMAKHFHYSTSHFTKLFKDETGTAPLEYFNKLKIHHACQLLDQSRLKVNEIALKVGFENPYYFSRLFTKIMGRSPKNYRAGNPIA